MMKTLTVLAAAGTMALAAVVAPAPAQARNEGAIAAGVVGGLAVGALIASQTNRNNSYGYERSNSYAYEPGRSYYSGAPYGYYRCYTTRQRVWTNYGPRWQRVRVCD